MPFKKSFSRPITLVAICVSLLLGSLLAFKIDDNFEISKNLQIFVDIYRELNLKYVDNIRSGEIMKRGVDAMLGSLDPYTEYIPEADIEDFKMKYVNPEYGGIGALIFQKKNKVIVSDVYEGFPAQKSDVRAGDQLLELNGIAINSQNSQLVSDMLKGQKGTPVKLTLLRPGMHAPIEKKIMREEIKLSNVSFAGVVRDHVGYIKLDRFLENSANEVREAFLSLKNKKKVTSLILDLRGNGGGILQESVKIVNFFVDKGETIVTQKGRNKEQEVVYKAVNLPLDTAIPLVVLVDKGTASASEIVSGALQDLERAVIVGQRSFGKGLVQQTVPLSYNSLMKLTVAKYYTPSGRCIQALDYFHRNKDGSVNQVADSSMNEFKTKNGRLVYDGSGIFPDLATKTRAYSTILYVLVNKQYLFDFATQYRNTHAQIESPLNFKLTDMEYKDFLTYLAGKDYQYISSTEKLMAELKNTAEKEKRFDDIKLEYLALKNKVNRKKEDDLIKFKDEIKEFLERDIVGRYYYQNGRLISSFTKDEEINQALRVFRNQANYAAILKGTGAYHAIGKPEKLSFAAQLKLREQVDSLLEEQEK